MEPSTETVDALIAEGYFQGPQNEPSVLATMIEAGADISTIRRSIVLGARLDTSENPLEAAAARYDPEMVRTVLHAGRQVFTREQVSVALAAASRESWRYRMSRQARGSKRRWSRAYAQAKCDRPLKRSSRSRYPCRMRTMPSG